MHRNGSSQRAEASSHARFGPRRLAEFATARPRLVLSLWGLLALAGIGLTSALLPSALTSDSGMTSNPESLRAQKVIEQRLRGADTVDELVTVRSERLP